MEIAVFLVVMVTFIVVVGKSGNERFDRRPPQSPPQDPRPTIRPQPTIQPRPFDSSTAQSTPEKKTISGYARIIDGDTIVIQKTQVRLFGIDAPEMDHPYGQKAKWALVALCKGQSIQAEVTEVDDYGRTVAKCCLPDGRDLSAEMVKQGLAIDWKKFSGGIYRNLETPDARKKLWLADARQKGRMHVWKKFEARSE